MILETPVITYPHWFLDEHQSSCPRVAIIFNDFVIGTQDIIASTSVKKTDITQIMFPVFFWQEFKWIV